MPQPRFNPPPNWPVPEGWTPPAGWEPDPSWPAAPPGWQFYLNAPATGLSRRWLLLALVAVVAVAAVGAFVYHRTNQPDIVILKPVDAQGNIVAGWIESVSRSTDHIDCSFGSPSRYDKTAGVRSCGSTADSADACWPATDRNHVLCLTDPFSNVVYLIGANGLTTPRKALTGDPIPFALLLDDGTQCRVRIGGAWSSPKEHPDWVGYYGCNSNPSRTSSRQSFAVWGPREEGTVTGGGIKQGFGGWTVEVGTENGHLSTHKVAKAVYVGIA
jgi:hypothetical protein